MIKIRLFRRGKKHKPYYNIVIANSTTKRDGKFIEKVGSYDPFKENNKVQLRNDRIIYWITQGAQPTKTILKFLIKNETPIPEKMSKKWIQRSNTWKENIK